MLIPILALAMIKSADRSYTLGSELNHQCKSYVALIDKTRVLDGMDEFDAGECLGYVDGLSAGLTSMRLMCAGPDASLATLIRIYLVYVDQHPKVLDYAASAGVTGALQEAYPYPVRQK